jgi:hypothetical protein
MKIRLRVTTDGEPYEVTTAFPNVIEWERKFKRQVSDLARGIGYEDMAFFAWAASKTAGITVPAVFDDFVKRVRDIEVLDDEPTNPTQEEHSTMG